MANVNNMPYPEGLNKKGTSFNGAGESRLDQWSSSDENSRQVWQSDEKVKLTGGYLFGSIADWNNFDIKKYITPLPSIDILVSGISVNSDTNNLDITKIDMKTHEPFFETLVMPIASDTKNGYESYTDHLTIEKLVSDVQVLQDSGGHFIGISFATVSDLEAYIVPDTVNAGDFTYVLDDEDHDDCIAHYTYSGTGWNFAFPVEQDPVGIATTLKPGIVLSSETAGRVFVEVNGEMSLVGYDAILTALDTKFNKSSVVQESGNSPELVMSQKAVTDAIENAEAYEEITYEDLKKNIENGTLLPGRHYLISDYSTVYVQPDTGSNMKMGERTVTDSPVEALVVTAETADKLSEIAFSASRPKDTVYYDIKNDDSKYSWVSPLGKGVIYRRIDEYGNDLPYDFKAIKFRRYAIDFDAIEIWDSSKNYARGNAVRVSGDYSNSVYACITANSGHSPSENSNTFWQAVLNDVAGSRKTYWSCNTTFDFIVNDRNTPYTLPVNTSDWIDMYTFHYYPTNDDMSNKGQAHGNIIGKLGNGIKSDLNNIVFTSWFDNEGISNNRIGHNFNRNTTGSNFMYNVINGECYMNTFGSKFHSNVIGMHFYGNHFTDENYYYNNIGNDFNCNLIQGEFCRNVLGHSFNSNVIGYGFISNVTGNYFQQNIAGNNFASNLTGNYCTDRNTGINVSFSNSGNEWEAVIGRNDIADTTGTSPVKVMSQKAVTEQIVELSDTITDMDATIEEQLADGLALKVDKTQIVQTTGTSQTDIISQKAVTDEFTSVNADMAAMLSDIEASLDLKVNRAQIVQATGTSETDIMSQSAVTVQIEAIDTVMESMKEEIDDALELKVDDSQIVQTTGTGTSNIMSQKAVTDTVNENITALKDELEEEITEGLALKIDRSEIVQATGTSETDIMSQNAVTDTVSELRTDLEEQITDGLSWKIDLTQTVQETGTSETDIMSQKAVTDELSLKIDKTSVVQTTGTGTEDIMSQYAVSSAVTALEENIASKVNSTQIVQATGTSTVNIMSQKAVTDGLAAYLPLSGGEINGNLTVNSSRVIININGSQTQAGQVLTTDGTTASWENIPSFAGTIETSAASQSTVPVAESLDQSLVLHDISKTGSWNDILNAPSIPQDVVTGIEVNSSSGNLNINTFNTSANTSSTTVATIPIASSLHNGYMPKEDHTSIETLVDDVAALKNSGGRFIGTSFATVEDLEAYTVPATVNAGDFTYVLDDEDHDDSVTHYTYNGTGWDFAFPVEQDPVGIATTLKPGIVLSSEEDGKIFVETTGEMSLVGYDAILSSVNTETAERQAEDASLQTQINSKQDLLNRTVITNLASQQAATDTGGNLSAGTTGILPVTSGGTGNTTGNAATATKLATARAIGGVNFDGSADITLPGVNATGNQDTTGNAATATKLATARAIGGVNFDGSADIILPGVNAAGNQNTTGNAATATKLATTRYINNVAFDGTANITVSIEGLLSYATTNGIDRQQGTNTYRNHSKIFEFAYTSNGSDAYCFIFTLQIINFTNGGGSRWLVDKTVNLVGQSSAVNLFRLTDNGSYGGSEVFLQLIYEKSTARFSMWVHYLQPSYNNMQRIIVKNLAGYSRINNYGAIYSIIPDAVYGNINEDDSTFNARWSDTSQYVVLTSTDA
jgi:hypothetical protein